MRIRESGMPDLEHWESLFDPAALLDALDFRKPLSEVADFGCGYGTFALALAQRTSGTVYAVDGDPAMLGLTQRRAREAGLRNVVPIEGDLLVEGSSLPAESVDAVLIAHLLHGEAMENVALLAEARRALRPGGQLGVIHWRRDVETPRGPPLEIRPTLDQMVGWVQEAGFSVDEIERRVLSEHHWGILIRGSSSRPNSSLTGVVHKPTLMMFCRGDGSLLIGEGLGLSSTSGLPRWDGSHVERGQSNSTLAEPDRAKGKEKGKEQDCGQGRERTQNSALGYSL